MFIIFTAVNPKLLKESAILVGIELNHSSFIILSPNSYLLARIFLLVDLRGFFSDLGSGERKKINKKALKMTS